MFQLFAKKNQPQGESVTFKITDMHCTSCAMNIDGALEETKGVFKATTSYAQALSTIEYDPQQVSPEKLQQTITEQGYTVEVV